MATRDWIGTDSGNEGKANVANNYSGAAVPTTNDTLQLVSGSQPINAQLGDLSGVDLAALYGGTDFSGDVGNANNYLEIGAALISFRSSGQWWLRNDTTSFDFDAVIGDSPAKLSMLNLKGTVGALHMKRGRATAVSGTFTVGHVAKNLESLLPYLKIVDASFTTLVVMGGDVLIDGAGTQALIHVLGGRVTVQSGTVTLINQWGGEVIWKTTATCTKATVYGGNFDASQDTRVKTFTDFEVHEGANVNLDNGPNNIVVTNDLLRIGGTVQFSNGTIKQVA